jgi:hypothetical protein
MVPLYAARIEDLGSGDFVRRVKWTPDLGPLVKV